MKHILCLLIVLTLVFCSACKASDGSVLPTSTTTSNFPAENKEMLSGNESEQDHMTSQSHGIQINEQNIDYFISVGIYKTRFIIEGTVVSKETLLPGQTCFKDSPYTYERYTLSDLSLITGRYEESTIEINLIPGYDIPGYEIGKRYIVFVSTSDSVVYPYDDPFYRNQGIFCLLGDDLSTIEELSLEGCATQTFRTKQDIVKLIEETVGITNEYYNNADKYVHSDVIEDIVREAPTIARVRVEQISRFSHALDQCTCSVVKLYKGTIYGLEKQIFVLCVHTDEAIAGMEYLVMFSDQIVDSLNMVASKRNSVIPLTDTERVQQVYDALGIQPEP